MEPEKGPIKRRRVDPAAALSRPFKSPLRRAQIDDSSQDSALETKDLAGATEAVRTRPTVESKETTETTEIIDTTDDASTSSAETVRILDYCEDTTSSHPVAPLQPTSVDIEMRSVQRQLRELESQADSLRFEQHAVHQAQSIETKKKSDQLQNLIRKWRSAGQTAAEEVLENARERVARRGGFRAFKQRTRRAVDRERYGDLEPEEIEELKKEAAANGYVQDSMAEDDSDELTMGYLLRILEIPKETIGFDDATNDWIRE